MDNLLTSFPNSINFQTEFIQETRYFELDPKFRPKTGFYDNNLYVLIIIDTTFAFMSLIYLLFLIKMLKKTFAFESMSKFLLLILISEAIYSIGTLISIEKIYKSDYSMNIISCYAQLILTIIGESSSSLFTLLYSYACFNFFIRSRKLSNITLSLLISLIYLFSISISIMSLYLSIDKINTIDIYHHRILRYWPDFYLNYEIKGVGSNMGIVIYSLIAICMLPIILFYIKLRKYFKEDEDYLIDMDEEYEKYGFIKSNISENSVKIPLIYIITYTIYFILLLLTHFIFSTNDFALFSFSLLTGILINLKGTFYFLFYLNEEQRKDFIDILSFESSKNDKRSSYDNIKSSRARSMNSTNNEKDSVDGGDYIHDPLK